MYIIYYLPMPYITLQLSSWCHHTG